MRRIRIILGWLLTAALECFVDVIPNHKSRTGPEQEKICSELLSFAFLFSR
jgi:hypothetical protein